MEGENRMSRCCMPLIDYEEWVTVYGFSPAKRGLVLREFEKCGVIRMGFVSPGESNWFHIQYQSPIEAQKALSKNGMQLSREVIIGVKPVDVMEREGIRYNLDNGLCTPYSTKTSHALPSKSKSGKSKTTRVVPSLLPRVVGMIFGW